MLLQVPLNALLVLLLLLLFWEGCWAYVFFLDRAAGLMWWHGGVQPQQVGLSAHRHKIWSRLKPTNWIWWGRQGTTNDKDDSLKKKKKRKTKSRPFSLLHESHFSSTQHTYNRLAPYKFCWNERDWQSSPYSKIQFCRARRYVGLY